MVVGTFLCDGIMMPSKNGFPFLSWRNLRPCQYDCWICKLLFVLLWPQWSYCPCYGHLQCLHSSPALTPAGHAHAYWESVLLPFALMLVPLSVIGEIVYLTRKLGSTLHSRRSCTLICLISPCKQKIREVIKLANGNKACKAFGSLQHAHAAVANGNEA